MINNNNNGGGAPTEAGIASQKAAAANQGGLKKGPWTAAEDAILIDYVKKHGEGNWNSVQKNSGLMRCGKSCRLRWANHLRPNLKKGSFTPEEERIIIELHASLGNKWARMASQLPGRTDNEIKNFWNTRMKRRQRAGLPIYPQEFQEVEASGFHIQQHQHSQDHQQKHPNNNSSSSSSFSSLLSSSRKASYNPSLSLLDPAVTFSPSSLNPLQNHHFTSFYSTPTLHFNSTNSSLALPSSNIPPFNHQNFALQTIPSLNYNNSNNTSDFETNNMNFTSLIMGSQVEPIGLIPGLKSELPSDQTPPYPNTPNDGVCVENNNDNDSETNRNNSGLLDALLFESHNLSRKEKFICENSVVAYDKGKRVIDEPIEEKEEKGEEDDEKKAFKRVKLTLTNGGEASCENHCCDDLSSSLSSIGMKPSDQEQIEEMNSMDDDYLFSLLANFPSSTPLPEWYRRRNISDGLSSDTIGGDGGDGGGLKDEQETSMADHGGRATATATNDTPTVEWAFGSSYWNNMPSIC